MTDLGYGSYIQVSGLIRTRYGERVTISIGHDDPSNHTSADIYNTDSGAPGDYRWEIIRNIERTFTNRDNYNPIHKPRLGSNVEVYIKRQRDRYKIIAIPLSRTPRNLPQEVEDYIYAIHHNAKHQALDDLLDDYRVRASVSETDLESEENGYPV